MPETTPMPGEEPRRGHPRLWLGLPAWLQTLDGPQRVRLVDLSQSGAHLVLSRPDPLRQAFLSWLTFEAFGDIVWQRGYEAGIRFDRLLPLGHMVETRKSAPTVVREESRDVRVAAKNWVGGDPNKVPDR